MTNHDPTRSPDDFIDVGHSQIAYWRVGQGPDLVFIHGWPLTSRTFRHLVATLSREFTCHLFDLPGTGETRWTAASKVGAAPHTDTMVQCIEHLGLERYGLIAHDSGGLVARRVAARHPDRVAAMVLGNTEIPGHFPWQIKAFGMLHKLPGAAGGLYLLLRNPWLRRSQIGLGACFEDPRYGEGEFFELMIAPLLDSKRKMAGQLMLLEQFEWGTQEELPTTHATMKCPTLLIWGDRDPYFPLAKARAMLPQLPGGSRLEVMKGARLFGHEDRAGEFLGHARPFLQTALTTAKAA